MLKRSLLIALVCCLPLATHAETVESLFGTNDAPTITATATGDPVPVRDWPNSAVQVVVGTCGGSYTLHIQGTINGTTWDNIELSGGSADITKSTVAANATDTYAIPAGYVKVRGDVTISSCTLSAFIARNP